MNHRQAAGVTPLPVWILVILLGGCTDPSLNLECAECEIQVRHERSIGADDAPGAISSWPTALTEDPNGHIVVVAPYAGEERALEFDETGRFVERLGGIGEGPGEFERAEYADFSGDSLFVYDRAQGRISVFGPDRTLARTFTGIPHIYRWVELRDGSFVANRTDYRSEPLVRLDREGEVQANFGPIYTEFDESAYLRPVRFLAPSSSGGVWSAQLAFEYVIREWSPSGGLVRTIRLDRPWYPAYETPQNPSPDHPPQSTVQGIWEDDSGRLWIVGIVADPDYQKGLGSPRKLEGRDVYEILDPDLIYDSVIEVIDPGPPARVLHHRRVSDHLFFAPEPGLLMSTQEDELGFVRIDLWRPHLSFSGATQRPNKR